VPEEEKFARGLRPGDIRRSLGLEVWHELLADLEDALEVV
jgi:O-acetylhomoserine/O-acetylserine sulfhydrylase-like pyridoxal-dependent enzyme